MNNINSLPFISYPPPLYYSNPPVDPRIQRVENVWHQNAPPPVYWPPAIPVYAPAPIPLQPAPNLVSSYAPIRGYNRAEEPVPTSQDQQEKEVKRYIAQNMGKSTSLLAKEILDKFEIAMPHSKIKKIQEKYQRRIRSETEVKSTPTTEQPNTTPRPSLLGRTVTFIETVQMMKDSLKEFYKETPRKAPKVTSRQANNPIPKSKKKQKNPDTKASDTLYFIKNSNQSPTQ